MNRLKGQSRRPHRARRGVALLECMLVLPLLAFFLMAILIMGWGMQNRQQTEISARLLGWAGAREITIFDGEVPERYGWNWDLVIRNNLMARRNQEETIGYSSLVGGTVSNADGIVVDTRDTLYEWVQAVTAAHDEAGAAAYMWMISTSHWEWGVGIEIRAVFPSPWSYWEYLGEKVVETWFVREGVEWRYGQIHNEQVITEEFLYDVDDALESVEDPGDALAAQFIWMYRAEW